MKIAYPIILTPDDNGYLVYVPDLDINTEGYDLADAIEMASDAISLSGIAMQDIGKEIPAPSAVLPHCAANETATFAVVDFDAYRRANEMNTVMSMLPDREQSLLLELAKKIVIAWKPDLANGENLQKNPLQ